MADTLEDEQKAAFLRFCSIIQQVISDKMFEGNFYFRQGATLTKSFLISILSTTLARIIMENLIVQDITAKDATTNSLMVNRQKGIWD